MLTGLAAAPLTDDDSDSLLEPLWRAQEAAEDLEPPPGWGDFLLKAAVFDVHRHPMAAFWLSAEMAAPYDLALCPVCGFPRRNGTYAPDCETAAPSGRPGADNPCSTASC